MPAVHRQSKHANAIRPVSPDGSRTHELNVLPERAFLTASEGRFVCCGPLSPDQHVFVDCNDLYSQQLRRHRDVVVGQAVRNVFLPASLARYVLAVTMLQKHGAIIVRNVPAYQIGRTYDFIAWTETTASLQDETTIRSVEPPQRMIVNVITINERPLRLLPSGIPQDAPSVETITVNSMQCQQQQQQQRQVSNSVVNTGVSAVADHTGSGYPVPSSHQLYEPVLGSPPHASHANSAYSAPFSGVPESYATDHCKGDRCAVIMALGTADSSDAEMVVLPWSSDGSDALESSPGSIATTRSQAPSILPSALLQQLPCVGVIHAPEVSLYHASATAAVGGGDVSPGPETSMFIPPTPKRYHSGVLRYHPS